LYTIIVLLITVACYSVS